MERRGYIRGKSGEKKTNLEEKGELKIMENERIEKALNWCKKRNIGSKQLNLFSRQYQKELKATKREKKLNKKSKNEEKFGDICQNLRAKEFKQMCKKANVEPGSLAKTIFTESLKSS